MSKTKIKAQLIIYKASQHSIFSQDCLKKRLYLSDLIPSCYIKSRSLIKRVSKAQICKYISRTTFGLSLQSPTLEGVPMRISRLFSFNFSEAFITISASNVETSSMNEKKIFRRFFRKHKRLQKVTLRLPGRHSLNENMFKYLFQITNLKNLHLVLYYASEINLKFFHDSLETIRKRKSWTSLISQKVTLVMMNKPEHDLNGYITRCSEGLCGMKRLLKETCSQLVILFNSYYRFDPDLWKRFVQVLEDLETLKRLELKGDIGNDQDFVNIMESVKDLKKLEKIDFHLKQMIGFPLQNIEDSLRDLSLALDILDASQSCNLGFFAELKRLKKLKSFCLASSAQVIGLNSDFLQFLSESLSGMIDLESLTLVLSFEKNTEKNMIKKGMERIFTMIRSFVRLEKLELRLKIEEENSFGLEMLCESLKSLLNLKSLALEWNLPKSGDHDLKSLITVLPKFQQLEEIILQITGKDQGADTVLLLFKNIARLKWLETINFSLNCSKIKDHFVSVFQQMMDQLRFLKEVAINVDRAIPNIETENEVREIMERRQNKIGMDGYFCISFGGDHEYY